MSEQDQSSGSEELAREIRELEEMGVRRIQIGSDEDGQPKFVSVNLLKASLNIRPPNNQETKP